MLNIDATDPPRSTTRGDPAASALRWLATAHAVVIFSQPVLAGLLLSGRYPALRLHASGADVVFFLGLALLPVAAIVWRRRGIRWPLLAALLLVLGETVQYSAGLARAVDLHLPLGVALVAGSVVLTVALWRPGRLEDHR